jgi:hypothetical protein
MKKLMIISGFILGWSLFSCNSSKIMSSWKAGNLPANKYRKIMVMALVKESDNALKEAMEQHLVGDLNEKGIEAMSSFQQYGPKAFENLTEAEAVQKIKNSGVDAIMTIVLLNKINERYYVPGRISYTPYASYYNRWWGYYSTLNRRVYMPGYYVNNTEFFWESNLYDAANKELVYSVQTKSFNPESAEALAHEYGKLIVGDMYGKAIFLPATPGPLN